MVIAADDAVGLTPVLSYMLCIVLLTFEQTIRVNWRRNVMNIEEGCAGARTPVTHRRQSASVVSPASYLDRLH